MSAPDCWACSVSSKQSFAAVAAVHAWMTMSGLLPRASAIANSSNCFRSSMVSDQNSPTPLVHHNIGCPRSSAQ
jgi:hypothetical protein